MRMTSDSDTKQFLGEYFERESIIAKKIELSGIQDLLKILKRVSECGDRVFIAGNGGSAATAEHFTVDLGVGSHIRNVKNVVTAVALTSNTSNITAISNDLTFKSVFSIQLEVLRPTKDDVVIVISASGNSPNIIELLECAKNLNITTCALTGFNGGRAKEIADISIHVPTEIGEYGIVEDLHLSICHAVAEALRR